MTPDQESTNLFLGLSYSSGVVDSLKTLFPGGSSTSSILGIVIAALIAEYTSNLDFHGRMVAGNQLLQLAEKVRELKGEFPLCAGGLTGE